MAAEFSPGDVVVLKSGSMRMLVERVEGDEVAVVWANEGAIGRDRLPVFALNKWEDRPPRDEGRGPPRGRPPGKGGAKPDRPKTGMDGKPRQKTYYRKDG